MKNSRCFITCALLVLFAPAAIPAQGTTTPEASENANKEPAPIPVRLQVVVSEYDGAKKVSSLPYSIPFVVVSSGKVGGPYASMRIGVRVPVTLASKTSETSVQY